MKQIIWIFGTSAAGKETFIWSIINKSDLRSKLGINSHTIGASNESLMNLGKLDGSRESILKDAESLIAFNDVVLIKWQYGDSQLGILEKLHGIYPDCIHRIIALEVSEKDQIERLRKKSWWHDIGLEKDFIVKESHLVKRTIEQLSDKYEVMYFKW